ncbi:CRISPR-associated protein Cas5 [Melioribacter sp. OK-6-Me]|uniref:CRISPR-associated protein Cas5 n=1 Tax=unclassified Melioribacter TaxID=2627329 RepID=UPI003ED91946
MAVVEKSYEVKFEIAGPAAMFTRPDTGATPISYPAPTYSAAKGMFESIARIKSAYIKPTKVEICAPIQYHQYTTNYRGPLRKSNQLSKDSSYQLFATILVDVCYRIYGEVVELKKPNPNEVTTTNHLHLLKEKFESRLKNGRWYHVPCLGWKEFTPTYVGPFREETKVEETIEQIIPSMLFSVFEINGEYKPIYKQNVWIKKGVLEYVE